MIARADCVVAVGTELAEVDLWRTELGHEGAFIRVDIDAESLAGVTDGHRLCMDATAFFRALDAGLSGHDADRMAG